MQQNDNEQQSSSPAPVNQVPPQTVAPAPATFTQQPVQPAVSAQTLPQNQVSFGNPPSSTMPPTPKRKLPMKLIVGFAVVIIFIFVGIIVAVMVLTPSADEQVSSDGLVFAPQKTPQAGSTEHTTQEYPDFQGVEVGEDTVSFNKVDESFQIKYRNKIFREQDTGDLKPRPADDLEAADSFPWYGMINAPSDLSGKGGVGDQLFSFKAPATYRSFVFIMRWDRPTGEVYEMYRFQDNKVAKLTEFTKTRSFYAPSIDAFSLGGNYISIKLTCPTCATDEYEILLYHIPSGEQRNIGSVSFFAWGDDDSAYKYKEYRPGVNPDLLTMQENQFFVDSKILEPK